jgi:hypothetical protein
MPAGGVDNPFIKYLHVFVAVQLLDSDAHNNRLLTFWILLFQGHQMAVTIAMAEGATKRRRLRHCAGGAACGIPR